MKKIIFLLTFNIFFAQANIETKEFTFYKDVDNHTIDFNTFIPNLEGSYEVKLINLKNKDQNRPINSS